MDALSLRAELHVLNEVFTNPNVVKVSEKKICMSISSSAQGKVHDLGV